jgi:hypothetical protein
LFKANKPKEETTMDQKRSEEIAANRLKIIASLTDKTLDKDKRQLLKESICAQTGLSERTIRGT